MLETYFAFKKTPFSDSPEAKQLFASQAWNPVKARLQFLVDHDGAGLPTGEVGAGKSTAARPFSAGLNPNLYKILYLHWTSRLGFGSCSASWPWNWIWSRRTTAATWCARSPKPSCASTRARSSIPFSSATKPNCCAIPPSNSYPCC